MAQIGTPLKPVEVTSKSQQMLGMPGFSQTGSNKFTFGNVPAPVMSKGLRPQTPQKKAIPLEKKKSIGVDMSRTYFTKTDFKKIAENAPEGVTAKDLLLSMDKKGKIIQGFNEDKMSGSSEVAPELFAGATKAGVSFVPRTTGGLLNIGTAFGEGLNKIDRMMGMNPQTPKALTQPGKDLVNIGQKAEDWVTKQYGELGVRSDTLAGEGGQLGMNILASVVGGPAGPSRPGRKEIIRQGVVKPLAKYVLPRTTIGVSEEIRYNLGKEGEVLSETRPYDMAIGPAAEVAVPMLPSAAKSAVKGASKLFKYGQKTAGKTAESLAVRGLINVSDAKKVVNAVKETGNGDVGSIGRWVIERGIAGKPTEEAIQASKRIAQENHAGVRYTINKVSAQVGALGPNEAVEKAMIIAGKQTDKANAYLGYDAYNKLEIENIRNASKDGTLTLEMTQRAKELLDELVDMFNKSSEVLDSRGAKEASKQRNIIKNNIEDTVANATQGKVNIREMNREVALGNIFAKSIENKAVANELKQFALQGGAGVAVGARGERDPGNPVRWGRLIIGGIMGMQIGKLLGSPQVMGKIGSWLDTLSGSSRANILQYMKNPTKTKLTQKAIEDLLSIKNDLTNSSIPDLVNAPMYKALPHKANQQITPKGVIQEVPTTNPPTKLTQVVETGMENVKQPTTVQPGKALPTKTEAPLAQVSTEAPKLPVAKKTPLVKATDSAKNVDIETSIQKAKAEGKTFEDFVSSQEKEGKILYHGTPNKFDEFSASKFGSTTDDGIVGKGVYLIEQKNFARGFAKDGADNYIMKVAVTSDNLFDMTKVKTVEQMSKKVDMPETAFYRDRNGTIIPKNMKQAAVFEKKLKDLGYDGAFFNRTPDMKEYAIFDTSKLKTEAQLKSMREGTTPTRLPANGTDTQKLSPKVKKPLIKAQVVSKVDDALPTAGKMDERLVIGKKYSFDEMLDLGADGNLQNAQLQEVPLNKIGGKEPTPSMEGSYKGRKITQPIEVSYDKLNDEYILYAGNHRVTQAELNGQDKIIAFVENYKDVPQANKPGLPAIGKTTTELPQKAKSLEPSDLTTSIKKAKAEGKTFEEFVKEKANFIHETDANFDKFDMSKIGGGQGDDWLGRGIYLQEKGTFKIEQYGKNKMDVALSPDAKIFVIKDTPKGKYRDNFVERAINNTDYGKYKLKTTLDDGLNPKSSIIPRDILWGKTEAVEKLKKMGYDGLLQDGELVIYNDKVLKTTSQLRTERDKLDQPTTVAIGKPVKKATPLTKLDNELMVEAKKYKSADEFVTPSSEQMQYWANNDQNGMKKYFDTRDSVQQIEVDKVRKEVLKKYSDTVEQLKDIKKEVNPETYKDIEKSLNDMIEKQVKEKMKGNDNWKDAMRRIREEATRK